jgi:hypothetical protein
VQVDDRIPSSPGARVPQRDRHRLSGLHHSVRRRMPGEGTPSAFKCLRSKPIVSATHELKHELGVLTQRGVCGVASTENVQRRHVARGEHAQTLFFLTHLSHPRYPWPHATHSRSLRAGAGTCGRASRLVMAHRKCALGIRAPAPRCRMLRAREGPRSPALFASSLCVQDDDAGADDDGQVRVCVLFTVCDAGVSAVTWRCTLSLP